MKIADVPGIRTGPGRANRVVSAAAAAAVAAVLALFPAALNAGPGSNPSPFTAGSARLSFAVGGATAFQRNYSVLGVGGGYFIADGIEAGLDYESWSGNSPHIQQISPQVRAVFTGTGDLRPYAGVFYRRTLIEGFRDLDTAGLRAGVFFLTGRNFFFGAGLAQEEHLNCDRTVYSHCSETYPELGFAVVF